MSEYIELTDTAAVPVRNYKAGDRALVVNGQDTAMVDMDTVQQAVDARIDEYRALVAGRLPFETAAEMINAGAPPNGEIALVWGDPVLANNGEFAWNGSEWVVSMATNTGLLKSVDRRTTVIENRASTQQFLPAANAKILPIAIGLVNGSLKTILGYNSAGQLRFDADDQTATELVDKALAGRGCKLTGFFSLKDAYSYAVVTDGDNPRLLHSISANGIQTNGGSSWPGLNLLDYPIMYHVINDGQSQANGYKSLPVLTAQGENDGYFIPAGGTEAQTTFAPLAEGGEIATSNNNGESPSAGLIQGVFKWLDQAHGIRVADTRCRFGISNSGVNGTTIDKYIVGGAHYGRFYKQVWGMKAAAQALGLQYQIHAFTWTLGGSDMNAGTAYQDYYDALTGIRSERESTLQTEMNRPVKLHCIAWQNGARVSGGALRTLDVPDAQRHAAENVEEIHIACPYYIFQFVDAVHLTNTSSKALGHFMGRVYREVVIRGRQWKPLFPDSITATGNVITAAFSLNNGRLEFDRDVIAKLPANEGFRVFDDSGELTITDVRIIAGCKVQITTSETLGSNPRLSYGEVWTGDGSALTGDHPRGTLRDNAGDHDKYVEYDVDVDGGPFEFPLHNFCLVFNELITTE
ncbi:hypothetical protein [Oceanobacter kriegii]|uniref:hypothetical protein n=1 Tax=Oceanobacter kriegii TaxID=64972 RepID=UPI0004059C7C|nr:hypothetical protein [Oceanobacter kriegii]